jgi:hypothetical protein
LTNKNQTINKRELWEYEDAEHLGSLNNTFYIETIKPYRLWYEYLRLSPTYWLAHKQSTGLEGGLSGSEESLIPHDFDHVIETYKNFGDIYSLPFHWWWQTVGARLFGQPVYDYEPHDLGNISTLDGSIVLNLMHALKNNVTVNGYSLPEPPDYIVLAIPLHGTQGKILEKVSSIIKSKVKPIEQPCTHVYTLMGERFRQDTLTKRLKLLWLNAEHPDWNLVKLGKEAPTSEKYLNLKLNETNRSHLNSMTSNMRRAAWLNVENAARGRFPCDDDTIQLPEIDYPSVWEGIGNRKTHDLDFLAKFQS